jgi:hypothetical protein
MRRPNIASAGGDFAFAALALAGGWLGATPAQAVLILIAAVAAWAWTRRRVLAGMSLAARATNSALALVVIAVVLSIAYWLGLMLGGHT